MGQRVIIVDFNHQVHTYFHSNHRLSTRLVVNGQVIEKDTTIQNGCIKNIHRWSNGGSNPTAVCFDRPVPARKGYWQSAFSDMQVGSGAEYKGSREKMPDAMYEGISDCESLMRQAGIACFARQNFEADDLVFACVKRAKEKYSDLPIDVITNDADLLPLVDDTVSVFLRSRKTTYAVEKSLEKSHYVQVTPQNFQAVVEDLSAYSGYIIPYNALLLHKLLRGDSSDGFQRKEISKLFPKTKWNAMILDMLDKDANFEEVFRYGEPIYEIYNKDTGEVWNGTMDEAIKSGVKSSLRKRLHDSEEWDAIKYLLSHFSVLDEEQIETVHKVYLGMNLNQPYVGNSELLTRHAYRVGKTEDVDITTFSEIELQKVLNPLKIRLLY